MRANERAPVSAYIKEFIKEIDGKAWVLVFIASLAALLDVLIGAKIIPIRETADFGKSIVLLVFSPPLAFLVLVMLRQLPFSSGNISTWVRVLACFGTFLIINF